MIVLAHTFVSWVLCDLDRRRPFTLIPPASLFLVPQGLLDAYRREYPEQMAELSSRGVVAVPEPVYHRIRERIIADSESRAFCPLLVRTFYAGNLTVSIDDYLVDLGRRNVVDPDSPMEVFTLPPSARVAIQARFPECWQSLLRDGLAPLSRDVSEDLIRLIGLEG